MSIIGGMFGLDAVPFGANGQPPHFLSDENMFFANATSAFSTINPGISDRAASGYRHIHASRWPSQTRHGGSYHQPLPDELRSHSTILVMA